MKKDYFLFFYVYWTMVTKKLSQLDWEKRLLIKQAKDEFPDTGKKVIDFLNDNFDNVVENLFGIKQNTHIGKFDVLKIINSKTNIDDILKYLPPKEKSILITFYGIGCDSANFQKISDTFDVSREAIRIIKEKGILKLRKIIKYILTNRTYSEKNFGLYISFFEDCSNILLNNGNIILEDSFIDELSAKYGFSRSEIKLLLQSYFDVIYLDRIEHKNFFINYSTPFCKKILKDVLPYIESYFKNMPIEIVDVDLFIGELKEQFLILDKINNEKFFLNLFSVLDSVIVSDYKIGNKYSYKINFSTRNAKLYNILYLAGRPLNFEQIFNFMKQRFPDFEGKKMSIKSILAINKNLFERYGEGIYGLKERNGIVDSYDEAIEKEI